MKIILCKYNDNPTIVELPKNHNYKDLKKLLEIDSPLTCISRKIGSKYYDFWCDDEGLFKDTKYACGVCLNAHEILCGNILITNHDGEGNTTGLSDKEIEEVFNLGFINNNEYLSFVGASKYPDNEDGQPMVVYNYQGFGSLFLHRDGSLLKYVV